MMKRCRPILFERRRTAVNRRRRIATQFDIHSFGPVPMRDVAAWRAKTFLCFDEPGSQVDAIWWDCDWANDESNVPVYGSHPYFGDNKELVDYWRRHKIDWPAIFVEETHRRGMEAFWTHRISEHDHQPGANPVKQAHPDWIIKSWSDTWNMAVPAVREFKTAELRRLAERYAFDGFQIDFARHVPVLPVGRQWELRDALTEFMRQVREALLAVEAASGRPILLAARVPQNLRACRADGFDVAAWVKLGLVDLLTVGSRSFEVGLEEFRRELGLDIKLYCGLDDHHATDAYQFPPIEVFRGVAANWWRQGADGIAVFNWFSAPPAAYTPPADNGSNGYPWYGPSSQMQAYHEIGSPDTLRNKDKIFPVERRGGYQWAEGEFNRNTHGQLPLLLRYDGTPSEIRLYCADDIGRVPGADARLGVTVYQSESGDRLDVRLNGKRLDHDRYDYGWKDPQIFSPQPQPNSGWYGYRRPDPNQKLLRLTCPVTPSAVRPGWNIVSIAVGRQTPHCCRQLQVEKVELEVRY